MTEEEKKAAETAKAEATAKAKADKEAADAKAAEEESEESDSEEEGKGSKKVDTKIDYEAELAKEKDARKKAEDALAAKRFKSKKAPKEEEEDAELEDEEEEEEDKPLTARELKTLLAQERQQTQKDMRAVQAEDIAKKMSGSDAEKNLILEIYKNRTFPAHLSLEDQLEEAYVIANRKKIVGERNEALRALRGKGGVNDNAAGTHREGQQGNAPKLPAGDESAIVAAGYTFNNTNRRYEKKLPNGDLLYRDPKTKATVHVRKS